MAVSEGSLTGEEKRAKEGGREGCAGAGLCFPALVRQACCYLFAGEGREVVDARGTAGRDSPRVLAAVRGLQVSIIAREILEK